MADDLIIRAELQGDVAEQVAQVRGQISQLQDEIRKVDRAGSSSTLKTLDSPFSRLQKALGPLNNGLNSLSQRLDSLVATGAKRAAVGLAALTTAAAGFGLKTAASFQQSQLSLNTFLGSVQKGGQLFNQLKTLQGPFNISDLTGAADALLTVGAAADKVQPLLNSIANIAAVQVDPNNAFSSLADAVNRVQETGRIDPRGAMAFFNNGVDIYGIIARQMGVQQNQVRALLQAQGQIAAPGLLDALVNMNDPALARFQGGLAAQRNTLGGMFGQLKVTVQNHLADAASPLAASFQKVLPGITLLVGNLIDKVAPPLVSLGGKVVDVFTRLAPIATPILSALATGVDALVAGLLPSLDKMAPEAGQLAGALGQFGTALMPLMPALGSLLVSLVPLAVTFVQLATNITTALMPVLLPLINGFAHLMQTSDGARTVVAGLLMGILAYRAISGTISVIGSLASAYRVLAGSATEAAVAQDAANGVGGVGGAAGLARFAGPAALGIGGALVLQQASRKKPGVGSDLALVGGAAGVGAAVGSVVPGIGTAIGAAGGALGGGIIVAGRHLLPSVFGDTTRPLSNSLGMFSSFDSATPGRRYITSGARGYGLGSLDSDHLTGHALDIGGAGLVGLMGNINRSGMGLAELHGSGASRHLHTAWGDTAHPYSPNGTMAGAGGVYIAPGGITVINPSATVDVQRAIRNYERDYNRRTSTPEKQR